MALCFHERFYCDFATSYRKRSSSFVCRCAFIVEKVWAKVRSGLFPIIFICFFRTLGAIRFSGSLLRVNVSFWQSFYSCTLTVIKHLFCSSLLLNFWCLFSPTKAGSSCLLDFWKHRRFDLEEYRVGRMFLCLQVCGLIILSSIENFNPQLTFSRTTFSINWLRSIPGNCRRPNLRALTDYRSDICLEKEVLMSHVILLRICFAPVWKRNACSSMNELGVSQTDWRKFFLPFW